MRLSRGRAASFIFFVEYLQTSLVKVLWLFQLITSTSNDALFVSDGRLQVSFDTVVFRRILVLDGKRR